jgi:hypothetical protein
VAEEHARLSLLVNKLIQLPALVLEDKISELYDLRTIGAGNRDFSILVELRRLHQTRHAAEGVRTRDVAKNNRPGESVRCKLILEMNTLLHQDQDHAPGTSQDRKLRWETPAKGTVSPVPELRRPAPVLTGNSANAATVAALRVRKVPFWPCQFMNSLN